MHLFVRELQYDDAVDVVALEEELGLASVAGKAVDDEPVVPVVEREAVAHHRLDEHVVHQPALRQDTAYLGTELGVLLQFQRKMSPTPMSTESRSAASSLD
ncbi:MAG TPA: hypothetical protein VE623_19045 [Acidimicrobiales bacterium]|nr:hypothetical protein [Acidimicrobiales bacterium]